RRAAPWTAWRWRYRLERSRGQYRTCARPGSAAAGAADVFQHLLDVAPGIHVAVAVHHRAAGIDQEGLAAAEAAVAALLQHAVAACGLAIGVGQQRERHLVLGGERGLRRDLVQAYPDHLRPGAAQGDDVVAEG